MVKKLLAVFGARSWRGRALATAGLAVAVASNVAAADLPTQKALECAAGIGIISVTEDPMDNALFHVVVEIANEASNDSLNMPQPNRFGPVSFYPHCAALSPPTCDTFPAGAGANPGLKFVPGSASSDCNAVADNAPVAFAAADMTDFIEFSFTPPLELKNSGAAFPRPETTCTISFDLRADPLPTMVMTFDVLTSVAGECQFPVAGPLPNEQTATDTIEFTPAVPTVGQYALAALALLLLAGSLVILHRRSDSRVG